MAKLAEVNEKIAKSVGSAYQKIENGVVGGYQKIEAGVVSRFSKLVDGCVRTLFAKEGESVEDARARLRGARPDHNEQK